MGHAARIVAGLGACEVGVDADFTLDGPAELLDHLRGTAERLLRALGPSSGERRDRAE